VAVNQLLKEISRKEQRRANSDESERLPSASASLDDLIGHGARFGTIYADPPWEYDNGVSRGAASRHYLTMSLDEIAEMPVGKLAAPACHLHLWATSSFLPDAFDILRAWGFTYKAQFVWAKSQMGVGNYWRISHENLLLGVKGDAVFAES